MTDETDDLNLLTADVLEASRPLLGLAVRSMAASGPQITAAQFRALLILARRGPLSLKELSHRLGLQPPTVSRLCGRLVAKGLIDRRPSPTSGRSVELSASAAGAAVVDSVFEERRIALREILATLSPADRAAIRDAMAIFATAARRLRRQTLDAGREFRPTA